jgi:thioredoxin 1
VDAIHLVTLTAANFKAEVLEASLPYFVSFWAGWCAPCKIVDPLFAEIASEYDGRARFGKVNIDDEEALAIEYGIRAVPTLLIFKNGEVVDKMIGAHAKHDLTSNLEKHLFC